MLLETMLNLSYAFIFVAAAAELAVISRPWGTFITAQRETARAEDDRAPEIGSRAVIFR